MDKDEKDLICHLFAKASALAEVAHDRAVQGQSARLETCDHTDAVEGLRQAVQGMLSITDAIGTIINLDCDERSIS